MTIGHISDTARWVAFYRAMESERPDALFRDPFARRLAGAEGERIVQELPSGRDTAWAMIVRTAIIDRLLRDAVRDGAVDLVVNLAAGLDARPWRMELPAGLRWVDMDLPDILDYKLETLADVAPVCAYEARRVDLTDPEARRRALSEVTRGSRSPLVVTEGLLVYLAPDQVTSLATDLHAVRELRSWIIDIASPWLLQWMRRKWGKQTDLGNATLRFAPEEGPAFFEPLGWREAAYYSHWEEGHRLGREARMAWLWRILGRLASRKRREEMRRIAGVVVLERTEG